jgi:hypothetical protein
MVAGSTKVGGWSKAIVTNKTRTSDQENIVANDITAKELAEKIAPLSQRLQQKDCVPGKLYCCVVEDFEYNHVYGELVWYGVDGKFYDSDTGEEVNPDYDWLVEQNGAFNQQFA